MASKDRDHPDSSAEVLSPGRGSEIQVPDLRWLEIPGSREEEERLGRRVGGLGRGVGLNLEAVNRGGLALRVLAGVEAPAVPASAAGVTKDDELRWEGKAGLGFSRPRAGEPRDGTCFACARRCGHPAACLSLGPGTWGNFFRLALCWDRILREHKAGSAEVHAGRGAGQGAGVWVCA